MQTTGLFTLHRYTVPVAKAGVPIRFVLFGDVHRDAPLHAKEEWQDFLSYARGLKDAYFLGMGDYLDSASTSERECLAGARLHESTRMDLAQLANSKVQLLDKELGFMRGRLIGLIGGNHYFQFESGTTSDHKLCEKLDCKFLGVSAFIRLTFVYRGARQTFDIWAHHGAGGARLPGGSINRVDQMREHADADLYVMGHDHKRGIIPATPRMSLKQDAKNSLRLNVRQPWVARSGSFLHAYDDGKVSYIVDTARGPSSIGHIEAEVTWRQEGCGDNDRRSLQVRGIA